MYQRHLGPKLAPKRGVQVLIGHDPPEFWLKCKVRNTYPPSARCNVHVERGDVYVERGACEVRSVKCECEVKCEVRNANAKCEVRSEVRSAKCECEE